MRISLHKPHSVGEDCVTSQKNVTNSTIKIFPQTIAIFMCTNFLTYRRCTLMLSWSALSFVKWLSVFSHILACVASVSSRIARKLEREQKENGRGRRKGGEETLQAVPSLPSPSPFIPFFALVLTRAEPLATQASHIPLLYLYSFLVESQSISKRQGPVLKGLKNDMEVVLKLKLLPFRRHLFCFVFAWGDILMTF